MFLLVSGGTGGGYYWVPFGRELILTEDQFPGQTLVAGLPHPLPRRRCTYARHGGFGALGPSLRSNESLRAAGGGMDCLWWESQGRGAPPTPGLPSHWAAGHAPP